MSPVRRFRTVVGLVLVAICLVAAAAWLVSPAPQPGAKADISRRAPQIVMLSAFLLLLVSRLFSGRNRRGEMAMAAVLWGTLGLVLVGGYAMRDELATVGQRTLAALVPGLAVRAPGSDAVLIARDTSGHFMIDGSVDGAPVHFMVDTGASSVMLTYDDAQAAGIDPASLVFAVPVQTANGEARAARVRLRVLALGPVVLNDVPALVAPRGALSVSLAGLSALDRLAGYSVRGDMLKLTP